MPKTKIKSMPATKLKNYYQPSLVTEMLTSAHMLISRKNSYMNRKVKLFAEASCFFMKKGRSA